MIKVDPVQIQDALNVGNKIQASVAQFVSELSARIAALGDDMDGEIKTVMIEFRDHYNILRERVDATQTELANALARYTENAVGIDHATSSKMVY